MNNAVFLLGDLAERVGAELLGDGTVGITHAKTIQDAGEGAICFLANSKYRHYLAETGASAVILRPEDAPGCPVAGLVTENPYLTYARVATLLYPEAVVKGGLHPSAVIDETAEIDPTAWVGPCAVIGPAVKIAAGVSIGPGCVLEEGCIIGEQTRMLARVTVCHGSQIGRRVLIHPGA